MVLVGRMTEAKQKVRKRHMKQRSYQKWTDQEKMKRRKEYVVKGKRKRKRWLRMQRKMERIRRKGKGYKKRKRTEREMESRRKEVTAQERRV
jgi:hypothetical protein